MFSKCNQNRNWSDNCTCVTKVCKGGVMLKSLEYGRFCFHVYSEKLWLVYAVKPRENLRKWTANIFISST